MRKPQVEHLWNDITLTLVSPEGAIMYHLISIMFFLMTRIEPVRWCYFTSVVVSHIWTLTVHSGVNFMSPSCNSEEETPVSCQYGFLGNGSVSVLTHIKKKKQKQEIHNTKCEIHTANEPERGIDLSLVCVIYEPSSSFRLHWPQKKFTLASHSHRTTRRCPCVATSNTLLLLHDSVSHDCSWASSSPRGPIK